MKKRTMKKLLALALAASMAAGASFTVLADTAEGDTTARAFAENGTGGAAEDPGTAEDGDVPVLENEEASAGTGETEDGSAGNGAEAAAESGAGMTKASSEESPEAGHDPQEAGGSKKEAGPGTGTDMPADADTGKTAAAAGTSGAMTDSPDGSEIGFDGPLGLDASGTGFVLSGNSIRYYYKGVMMTGWKKIGSDTYYFDSSGNMAVGFKTINGFLYHFGKNGRQACGWHTISGNRYYFYPVTDGSHYKGTAAKNFAAVNGSTYYFGDDGVMRTEWQTINGFRYYFGSDGAMRTGWQTIGGEKYYFFGSTLKQYKRHYRGTAATCLNKVGNDWYYMDPSTGACQSGWKDFEGLKYYFWPGTFKTATGTVSINEKKYNFSASGILQNSDYFKITMIDLGGGAAVWGDQTLLESNGRYLLIDTGIKDTRTAISYLKDHKIRSFDLMISHYDQDHVGNYGRILKDSYFNVGTVYLPASGGGYDTMARKYAKKCVVMKAGTSVDFGSVKGKVLYRQGNAWENNGSAAVMFTGGGIKYLTCGDLELGGEKALMDRADIKADIFKFDHHGDSGTANGSEFIRRIDADICLSNCCGDTTKTMNTWAAGAYSRGRNAGGMVLSSRYNGSVSITAKSGHMSVSLPRHGTTKTVTVFNVRTGNYEKVKIRVNDNNSRLNSNAMLPAGYSLER